MSVTAFVGQSIAEQMDTQNCTLMSSDNAESSVEVQNVIAGLSEHGINAVTPQAEQGLALNFNGQSTAARLDGAPQQDMGPAPEAPKPDFANNSGLSMG
jgi:hypothetical protein